VNGYGIDTLKRYLGFDIPFHQFSKKALKSVVRGWFRRATKNSIKGKRGTPGMVQVTTWKDRKCIIFVHTHSINGSGNETTKRYVKGKTFRKEIDCPLPPSCERLFI
jgi:hypothetical protein